MVESFQIISEIQQTVRATEVQRRMNSPPAGGDVNKLVNDNATRVAAAGGLLQPKPRLLVTDHQWVADVNDAQFRDHVLTRVSAKKRLFRNVDFRYSVFDVCYLRDCTFDTCDFTGCRFTGTSFHGSTFVGCKFDYASFEKTLIANAILDECCPPFENVKGRFARALRVNYQGLGDAVSANKAVLVELDATRVHLYKSWHSNEAYYRKKYAGVRRLKAFFEWLGFKTLDVLWGNGESAAKLARSVLVFLAAFALYDVFAHRDPRLVASYGSAVLYAPQVFLGTAPPLLGGLASAGIVFLRLVTFGLFVSILVRRFARR